MSYLDDFKPVATYGNPNEPSPNPPEELSDYEIQMIHAGLMIPNGKAILSMSREIRKFRGVKNPDLI